MKLIVPLLGLLLLAAAPLRAQMSDDLATETQPPAGSTLINSDELHSDEATHISDFIGNVVVIGQNFHMTCQEMKVYFTNDNKVQKIVATGDVVITQPGRVTHCGHAEYYQDSDTFDLTEEPIIYQGTDKVLKGTEIIIDRKSQKLTTQKGRTTVIIKNSSMNAATTTPNVAPDNAPLPSSAPTPANK
jgi:lipopolysaccharide transport protein LptA